MSSSDKPTAAKPPAQDVSGCAANPIHQEKSAAEKSAPRGLAGPNAEKSICLALQGGGAHGAFTWGVLDALLEDGRLAIEAISGTSAGAMNAVVLVEGFLEGGLEGARNQLAQFWQGVSYDGKLPDFQRKFMNRFLSGGPADVSPGTWWFDMWSKMVSPYTANPLNINPLKELLATLINFEKVRACDQVKMYIAATNVRTGKLKVFEGQSLTADHLTASACLPTVFQAVEIDGEHYWDGGYLGNPVLYPLFYEAATDDVLLVQINPIERADIPRQANEIQNRLTEITFNGTVLREFRAIAFVSRLIDEGVLDPKTYKRVNMHRIDGGAPMLEFTASSRMEADWDFFQTLRDFGRAAGKSWLDQNYDSVGVKSTLDLHEVIS